jgi:hypothetical protein
MSKCVVDAYTPAKSMAGRKNVSGKKSNPLLNRALNTPATPSRTTDESKALN